MGNAATAAAVGAAFWSLVAAGFWVARGTSAAWVALSVVAGWGLGGACAWRMERGWKRWSQILGVFFVCVGPALLASITAPSFSRLFRESRANEALQREVPAVSKLGAAGPEERPAIIARVADTLGSKDPLVRLGAARFFESNQANGHPFAGRLTPLLDDPVEDVRWAAARALSNAGPAGIAALLDYLPKAGPEGAAAVRGALERGMTVSTGEALSFATLATDRNTPAAARAAAVYAVGQARPVPPTAADHLKRALGDPDPAVRREAARVLGQSGDGSAAFGAAKTDSDPQVRANAFFALAASTPVALSHVPDVMRGLRDANPMVRAAAGQAAALLADWPPEMIGRLVEMVDDPDRGASWKAIGALGAAGPKAAPGVDRLTRLAKEGDARYEGLMAIDALSRLGPVAAPAVPTVRQWAKRHPDKAHVAIRFFVGVGEPGYAALPDLIEMLEKGNDPIRNNAAKALGDMAGAPDAATAIPALERARSDTAFGVKYLAEKSLEKIRRAQGG